MRTITEYINENSFVFEGNKLPSKITLASFKAFLNRNKGKLYIKTKSSFNGMIDGIEYKKEDFEPVKYIDNNTHSTLGIAGVWITQSRNSFEKYEDDKYIGVDVYNSTGEFIVAIKK